MSYLRVYREDDSQKILFESGNHQAIAEQLQQAGIRFEQWATQSPLPSDADDQQVMTAYHDDIERLRQEEGYQAVDVIRVSPALDRKAELRQKFLSEHIHTEDEVRFFVEGQGLFSLRIQGKVYATLCQTGDLISVPAGTLHWFDMGADPSFTAIRLFNNPDGWVAQFTGNPIAQQFPTYDRYLSKQAA